MQNDLKIKAEGSYDYKFKQLDYEKQELLASSEDLEKQEVNLAKQKIKQEGMFAGLITSEF